MPTRDRLKSYIPLSDLDFFAAVMRKSCDRRGELLAWMIKAEIPQEDHTVLLRHIERNKHHHRGHALDELEQILDDMESAKRKILGANMIIHGNELSELPVQFPPWEGQTLSKFIPNDSHEVFKIVLRPSNERSDRLTEMFRKLSVPEEHWDLLRYEFENSKESVRIQIVECLREAKEFYRRRLEQLELAKTMARHAMMCLQCVQ